MTLVAVRPGTLPAHQERAPCGARCAALAQAPVDEYGIVEAALAWQHLRQTGSPMTVDPPERPPAPGAAGRPPHLPIAYTDHQPVATRLARVLTGLTWAVLTEAGTAAGPHTCVAVPRNDYHRVVRALTGTWRHCRREFGAAPRVPTGPAPVVDPAAAIALWRMGLLLHGGKPTPLHGGEAIDEPIQVCTPVPAAAEMLHRAARMLGVTASVEQRRGSRRVLVCHPGDVRRLLAMTGIRVAASPVRGRWASLNGPSPHRH